MATKPTNAHRCIKVSYIIKISFFLYVLAALVAIFLEVTQDRCNKILTQICDPMHRCKTLLHIYNFLHLCAFAGFVTISNCSIHGRGLFKSQASIQIRIPLNIFQHLVAKVVYVYVYIYIYILSPWP
jgi:hypothetical protein